MNVILLLFLLGLLFMFIEVITPGAVFGILGGLTMVAGIVVAAFTYGTQGGLIAGLVGLLALCAMLFAEIVWLPKTRLAQKFAVRSTSGSTIDQLHVDAGAVVGKAAEAVTTLAPSGYVTVDGRRYEAFCADGHVARGTQLRVTGLDNFRLIVTKT